MGQMAGVTRWEADMDDLLNEFLTETSESIDVVDVELVKLEQNPNDKEVLDNIFRLVHTIKGTCGFLGLPRLESVAHASENVLGKFRDGELKVSENAVTVILESLDRIKEILAGLEATEEEPAGDDTDLIGRLDAIAEGQDQAAPDPEPDTVDGEIIDPGLGRSLKPGEVSLEELEAIFANAPGPDDVEETQEDTEGDTSENGPKAAVQRDAISGEAVDNISDSKINLAEETPSNAPEVRRSSQSIRVSVDLLEDLMNMVSELVLTRNQLLQISRNMDNSDLGVPMQRLSQCTTELQENVMKTRMQPIGNAWAKLPRIVRDLTVDLNKKIELEMLGADTELDRQVLELIKDPLTHMVRNSADHGIEMPAERAAAGKPEVGSITLNAYHEGGYIIIQLDDDGRGISPKRLSKTIIEKQLATQAELAAMSDNQIQKFIFHPGFSTADEVTSVSGRGVGMDVVRTNIEKIGGTIDMVSTVGEGSSFSIKIPLTLAIVAGLIVKAQNERYAIPQISVLELVRTTSAEKAGENDHKIEKINDTPVLRLRDHLLPLVYLNEMLGFCTRAEIEAREKADDFIVVSQVGAFKFGIVVDQVFDTEEIVVKPVAPILKDLNIYSGNTILGDGSVIMILDPNGIAEHASAGASEAAVEEAEVENQLNLAMADEKESMLVFTAGQDYPKAVPLSLVARLEEINLDEVEMSDGRLMVQYRGALMPLILADSDMTMREQGKQPVLVFTDRQFTMGLAVDEIVDIVEGDLDIELTSEKDGVIGSAVIDGKASEVIDVTHFIVKAFPDWLSTKDANSADSSTNPAGRGLIVDDSDFFRNMLRPLLVAAGYDVTVANCAKSALQLLEEDAGYEFIISDIDMPGMSGNAFARTVRANPSWNDIRLIALSALADEKDIERGFDAGFDDYLAKFNKDILLHRLSGQLQIQGDAA